MAVWFVSRHKGAVEWIKQKKIHIDHFVEHLDVSYIKAGDIIIGTLPIHLAAIVCEKGATFYFLSVNLSHKQRGTELTVDQLNHLNCSIQKFHIKKL